MKNISKEEDSDLNLSIEEEDILNDKEIVPTNKLSSKISNKKDKNKKLFSRNKYSNLIKKLYDITNNRQIKIKSEGKYNNTKNKKILDKYIKELEDKIIEMKNLYIKILNKNHFEKDKKKSEKIIKEANVPKKRNEVKKIYKELISLISHKIKSEENKKYYYLFILKLLKKYKKIKKEEFINENIQQRSKSDIFFKIFMAALPLIYVISYIYAFSNN